MNVIFPATEAHVRKHTDQKFHMVVETKEAYNQVTKTYIDSIPREKIEWVYNILERYGRIYYAYRMDVAGVLTRLLVPAASRRRSASSLRTCTPRPASCCSPTSSGPTLPM